MNNDLITLARSPFFNKFYDDAEKPEEWEEDYDNLDLRMLQDKYPKDNSNMRFNGQHLVNR